MGHSQLRCPAHAFTVDAPVSRHLVQVHWTALANVMQEYGSDGPGIAGEYVTHMSLTRIRPAGGRAFTRCLLALIRAAAGSESLAGWRSDSESAPPLELRAGELRAGERIYYVTSLVEKSGC
jgi:hypothetical protein